MLSPSGIEAVWPLTGVTIGETQVSFPGRAVVTVLTVAACVFVGASVFALTGLVLSDPGVTVARVLDVLVVQVLYDVAVTPLVLPPLLGVLRRLEPAQERWVHA